MAAKIKKGDYVVVIAGKDKGQKGEVLKVFPKQSRVVVKGIKMVKRKDNTPTRVGFKTLKDGQKVRVTKKSGEVIDG